MFAVCEIMGTEKSWDEGRCLLSSCVKNRDRADEISIWNDYDLKLYFLLKSFNVYERASLETVEKIIKYIDSGKKQCNDVVTTHGSAISCLRSFVEHTCEYLKEAIQTKPTWKCVQELDIKIKKIQWDISRHTSVLNPLCEARTFLEKETSKLVNSFK